MARVAALAIAAAVVLRIADCGLRADESAIQSAVRNPQSAMHAIHLVSPSGLVSFDLSRDSSGKLTYTVLLGSDLVVEPSSLGIVVDGRNLGEGAEIGRAEPYNPQRPHVAEPANRFGISRQGRYDALIVRDNGDDPAAVIVEKTALTATTPLTAELRAAGGFIARLNPEP
jgi:hypothetical protein